MVSGRLECMRSAFKITRPGFKIIRPGFKPEPPGRNKPQILKTNPGSREPLDFKEGPPNSQDALNKFSKTDSIEEAPTKPGPTLAFSRAHLFLEQLHLLFLAVFGLSCPKFHQAPSSHQAAAKLATRYQTRGRRWDLEPGLGTAV